MKANPLWNEMDCREREWLVRLEWGRGTDGAPGLAAHLGTGAGTLGCVVKVPVRQVAVFGFHVPRPLRNVFGILSTVRSKMNGSLLHCGRECGMMRPL